MNQSRPSTMHSSGCRAGGGRLHQGAARAAPTIFFTTNGRVTAEELAERHTTIDQATVYRYVLRASKRSV